MRTRHIPVAILLGWATVIAARADEVVATTTTTTSSSGGGGAPSVWFLAGLGLLAAGRRLFRRQGIAE